MNHASGGPVMCESTAALSAYLSPVSISTFSFSSCQCAKEAYISSTTILGSSAVPARNHWYVRAPGSVSCTRVDSSWAISSICFVC
jgi:hypothetical protein